MNKIHKILILNVGWLNKGNRALVDTTIETINNFVHNVEFNLMGPVKIDRDEFVVTEQIAIGVSIRKPHHAIISLLCLFQCLFLNIFKRFNVHIPIPKTSRLFVYYDSDIVINSGGDSLSGGGGGGNIGTLTSLMNIFYAILLDKPVILYGESLGYFKNSVLNSIAKFILNRTKVIIVRENLSKKYLDDNHITNPKIYVTSDPAFLLNPISESQVLEILSKENIHDLQEPLIGINPSGLIAKFRRKSTQKAEEEIVNIMAKCIDDLVDNLNATILMIPHVYTREDDDRIVINEIFDEVKNKSKVKIIKNEYTPQELKGIIGQCDLFIGARMHATIASTSMLVPTIGIAYSHKMYGIIGEMLGQEKYVLDIKELDYESLIWKINDAWENREKIKKELEMQIPMIKEKAMLNGKLVKELLDSLKTS